MTSNQKHRDARAASHRSDEGDAFLPDPATTRRHNALVSTEGESFAEEFIASATAGEPAVMEAQDEVVDEEWGGPFLELEAQEAEATDAIPEPPALHKLPPRLH
jgi:hypothetical protein